MSKLDNLKLQRVVMEVFGGCNYTCQMCPQSNPGRGSSFTRKMPLENFEEFLMILFQNMEIHKLILKVVVNLQWQKI